MEKRQLISEVVKLQREVGRTLGDYAAGALIDSGITITQLKSLFIITNRDGVNSRGVAEALRVTPSNVTGIIDRLLEQGLVSRTENPKDRREMKLQATDKGRALVANLREGGTKHMTAILTLLTPEELSTLSQGLSAFIRAAKARKGKT